MSGDTGTIDKKTFNIVLVDDEEPLCNILEGFFQSEGHNVAAFFDPFLALDYAKKNKSIDYFFSDIGMRGMDGVELVKQVHELHPQAKKYLMSGFIAPEVRAEIDALKLTGVVSGYLQKPIDIRQFLSLIE
jgi:DNA-binding NtrC family response regulator